MQDASFWFKIEMWQNCHFDPWESIFTCKSAAGPQLKLFILQRRVRRSLAAGTAAWKSGCETRDKCQSAWERASNAVRIMVNTLKQKQISPNLAEATQQREKWKHVIPWSGCVRFGGDCIYRQGAAENLIMWSFLMTTNDEEDEGRVDVKHRLHGRKHPFLTKAKTAARSETYQGVTINIYHLLVHLHSICCRLTMRNRICVFFVCVYVFSPNQIAPWWPVLILKGPNHFLDENNLTFSQPTAMWIKKHINMCIFKTISD